MLDAAKLLTPSVVLALLGGVLLGGLLLQPTDARSPAAVVLVATAASEPGHRSNATEAPAAVSVAMVPEVARLPDTIPQRIDGVERVASGRFETPIGPARWVHLYGTDPSLPEFLDVVRVAGGYVTPELPGQLWFSPDLLRWSKLRPPVDSLWAHLTASGSDYFLTTQGEPQERLSVGPTRLWRSVDAREWSEIDLGALAPPEPSTVDWAVVVGGDRTIASLGSIALAPLTYQAADIGGALGLDLEHDAIGLRPGDDGTYTVMGHYAGELARVRFEETAEGLRVVNADDGQELGFARGLDPATIEAWAEQGDWIQERRLAVIDGTDVRYGLLPGTPGSEVGVWAVDGEFLATAVRPDRTLETWTSADGAAWTPRDILGDDPGELRGFSWLPQRDQDGTWWAWSVTTDGKTGSWASDDLVEWRQFRPNRIPMGDHFVRLKAERLRVETSDGKTEMDLDITPLRERASLPQIPDGATDCGGGSAGSLELGPGLIAHHRSTECRSHDIFIVEFERFAR